MFNLENFSEFVSSVGAKFYIFYTDNSSNSFWVKSGIISLFVNFSMPWEELITKVIIAICICTVSYVTQLLLAILLPYDKMKNFLIKKKIIKSKNQTIEPNDYDEN